MRAIELVHLLAYGVKLQAINSIKVQFEPSANIAADSTFTLYGIKAA